MSLFTQSALIAPVWRIAEIGASAICDEADGHQPQKLYFTAISPLELRRYCPEKPSASCPQVYWRSNAVRIWFGKRIQVRFGGCSP